MSANRTLRPCPARQPIWPCYSGEVQDVAILERDVGIHLVGNHVFKISFTPEIRYGRTSQTEVVETLFCRSAGHRKGVHERHCGAQGEARVRRLTQHVNELIVAVGCTEVVPGGAGCCIARLPSSTSAKVDPQHLIAATEDGATGQPCFVLRRPRRWEVRLHALPRRGESADARNCSTPGKATRPRTYT